MTAVPAMTSLALPTMSESQLLLCALYLVHGRRRAWWSNRGLYIVHGRCCAWQMLCLVDQMSLVHCAWQMLCMFDQFCLDTLYAVHRKCCLWCTKLSLRCVMLLSCHHCGRLLIPPLCFCPPQSDSTALLVVSVVSTCASYGVWLTFWLNLCCYRCLKDLEDECASSDHGGCWHQDYTVNGQTKTYSACKDNLEQYQVHIMQLSPNMQFLSNMQVLFLSCCLLQLMCLDVVLKSLLWHVTSNITLLLTRGGFNSRLVL